MDSKIVVARTSGDFVFDNTGRQYLDLCMGYGSVSFGHNHPAIVQCIKQQLDRSYSPGFLDMPVRDDAIQALNTLLPSTHRTQAIFSTGMECVEASLRLAAHITHRNKFAAFQRSMHGKSMLTATLAGKHQGFGEHHITSVPYIDAQPEDAVLRNVENLLSSENYAVLLVEPIQMSSNGKLPTIAFLNELHRICRRFGTLMIFDEILSGFYRSGDLFFSQALLTTPDIVLTGKALGNGLPTAALILNKAIDTSTLSYRIESTYTNHPLTCAAVCAGITISNETPLTNKINDIENVINDRLDNNKLFGKGAMWCYQLDSSHSALEFAEKLLDKNIIVSFFNGYIRLLPSYFIDLDLLANACEKIRAADEKY